MGLLNQKIKEAFEFFAPELAENDDERIRKFLIDMVKRETGFAGFPSQGQVLAYLEKQKEHQNKSDAQEKALGRDLTFPQDKDKNLDEIAQDYVDRVKECNPEPTWNLMQTAVCYGYHCCEQKEQKPVEDKSFYEWVEDYYSHNKVNNPHSYDKGDEIQFDHKGFISFCEAYCYPQNLVLHDTFGYEEGRQTGQNEGVKLVLNNPEKYGLQKPVEWSEEDEEMLNSIIMVVCGIGVQPSNGLREKQVRFLKSHLPSWKPSEEQMNVLSIVIDEYYHACTKGSDDKSKTLKTLFEQLKKL